MAKLIRAIAAIAIINGGLILSNEIVISYLYNRDKWEIPNGVGDICCGPRCLMFVIDYYKIPTNDSLIDIVRTVQWPDFERGTSIGRMKEYLEERSIFSIVYKYKGDNYVRLQWEHPVIVHMRKIGDPKSGHYMVLLPRAAQGKGVLWLGLEGFRSDDLSRLSGYEVDYFILTSDQPIERIRIEDVFRAG